MKIIICFTLISGSLAFADWRSENANKFLPTGAQGIWNGTAVKASSKTADLKIDESKAEFRSNNSGQSFYKTGSWSSGETNQFTYAEAESDGKITATGVTLNEDSLSSLTSCSGVRRWQEDSNEIGCITVTRASCDAVLGTIEKIALERKQPSSKVSQDLKAKAGQCSEALNSYKDIFAAMTERLKSNENKREYFGAANSDALNIKKSLRSASNQSGPAFLPGNGTEVRLLSTFDNVKSYAQDSMPKTINAIQVVETMISNCEKFKSSFKAPAIGNVAPSRLTPAKDGAK